MNVLIYAGSTTAPSRLSSQLRENLRRLLSSAYDIKLVDHHVLNHHPWQKHTSLIIFPDLDQDEHDTLAGLTHQSLCQWVGQGGKFLGMGTGARFSGKHHLRLVDLDWIQEHSSILNSSPEAQSSREITLLQKNIESSTISIDSHQTLFTTSLPDNSSSEQLNLWASIDDGKQKRIAGVGSNYQAGYVMVVGFDLSSNIECLVNILELMGIEGLNKMLDCDFGVTSTLYLLSCLSSVNISKIHQDILENSINENETKILKDSNNTFMIITDKEPRTSTDPSTQVLMLCPETNLHPSVSLSFDLKQYFSSIDHSSTIGTTVLYGETVSSTQTLLEKNSKLADFLPNGTVSIANKQTKGRGRGGNSWISSTGSIQFSLLVKAENMGSSVVFVQYLFGLAVVEWMKKKFKGKLLVKLKWPNDIYGSTGGNQMSDFKKIGGILVNCSLDGPKGTENRLVIGLGLNQQMSPHSTTTSLAEIINSNNKAIDQDHQPNLCSSEHLQLPSVEETVAEVLNCFGPMWNKFLYQGFQPFMSLYLSHWLHTDQVITYEKTGERLKILGIDSNFGLLRTQLIHDDHLHFNTKNEKIINLQPDSNSFDMFSGLIKTKI